MAVDGTSMPNDAGQYRVIPSVARPDQANPPSDLSQASRAAAADNATDIPRSVRDRGQTGEVMTGIGDQLPANVEKKRLDDADLDPRAHGHDRAFKHAVKNAPFTKLAGEGPDVQPAPGEEGDGQDVLRERRRA
ncbi:hypothetical protein AOQ84DRAFT_86378 [Glonium stellatum]|uniref:Uncharacterized protein n=1 Tax=Glonium stellatum TaxID=574774 RepID=A0A8E2JQL9_9PEZI|nr:hypothetical protein AOQ84DRAFT_86378 [Glonium stellatum]